MSSRSSKKRIKINVKQHKDDDDDDDDDDEAGGGGYDDDDDDNDEERKEMDEDKDDDDDEWDGYDDDDKEVERPTELDDIADEEENAGVDKIEERLKKIANESAERVNVTMAAKSLAAKAAMAKAEKTLPEMTESLFAKADNIEGLSENFLLTRWSAPTVMRALEFKAEQIFLGGTLSIGKAKLTSSESLGIGMVTFFQFEKSVAILFFFMTLLSLPAMLFSYFGAGIPTTEQDQLGLYKFTVGNFGPTESNCSLVGEDTLLAPFNSTDCFNLGGFYKVSTIYASNLLVLMELLQILLYFAVVWRISRKFKELTKNASVAESVLSIKDYAVVVTNVPQDITVEEVVAHFSELYQLESADFKKRPGLEHALPVAPNEFNSNPVFHKTWVADVILHRELGPFLRAFKKKIPWMDVIYEQRSRMKMYANNTPHAKGPNPKKYKRAEKKLIKAMKKIDRISRHVEWEIGADHDKLKIKPVPVPVPEDGASSNTEVIPIVADIETGIIPANNSPEIEGKIEGSLSSPSKKDTSSEQPLVISAADASSQDTTAATATDVEPIPIDPIKVSIEASKNGRVMAAFVTFNYSESMARCVEDYSFYQSFPFKYFCCLPQKMRLRGYNIHVEQAEEPADIYWENMETTVYRKLVPSIFANVGTFVLFIISFAIILQVAFYQREFSESTPDLSFCTLDIPLFFAGGDSSLIPGLSFAGPPGGDYQFYDGSCDVTQSGSFYGIFENGDTLQPAVPYSFSVCNGTLSGGNNTVSLGNSTYTYSGMCPHKNQTVFCPCVDLDSNEKCTSYDNSTTFPASTIAYCYCLDHLKSILSGGIMQVWDHIQTVGIDDKCYLFIIEYGSMISITYFAVVCVVVINKLLKAQIRVSTRQEFYSSVGLQQESLLYKLFICCYLNLVVIVLIAFSRFDGQVPFTSYEYKDIPFKTILDTFGLFQGSFPDFTRAWYSTVGPFLIMIFILEFFTPMIPSLFSFYVSKPLFRMCYYVHIADMKTHIFANQYDLNLSQVGPVYDPVSTAAQLLIVLFFTMTFAPGLPILQLLGFLVFLLYARYDSHLFLRYYRRPNNVEEEVGKSILRMLPWAALIRLAVACWMYGNTDIFPSGIVDNPFIGSYKEAYISNMQKYSVHFSSYLNFAPRLLLPNIFPMLFIIAVILIVKFVRKIWRLLPVYWLISIYQTLARMYDNYRKKVKLTESGKVKGFDLLQLGHPLRREMAPFTGGYFKYIARTGKPPGCCGRIVTLTEDEEAENWKILPHPKDPEFEIKARIVPSSVTYGVIRNKGDFRWTFELFKMKNLPYSYDIQFLDAFKMKMRDVPEQLMTTMMYHAERNKFEPTVSDIIATSGIKRSVYEEYKILTKKIVDREAKIAASRPELVWKKAVDPNSLDKYKYNKEDDDDDGNDDGQESEEEDGADEGDGNDDYAGDTADDDDD